MIISARWGKLVRGLYLYTINYHLFETTTTPSYKFFLNDYQIYNCNICVRHISSI